MESGAPVRFSGAHTSSKGYVRRPERGAGRAAIIPSGRRESHFRGDGKDRRGEYGMPTSIRKVVVASFIGTAIEWYDYFIFVTAAGLVLGSFALISFLSGDAHLTWEQQG